MPRCRGAAPRLFGPGCPPAGPTSRPLRAKGSCRGAAQLLRRVSDRATASTKRRILNSPPLASDDDLPAGGERGHREGKLSFGSAFQTLRSLKPSCRCGGPARSDARPSAATYNLSLETRHAAVDQPAAQRGAARVVVPRPSGGCAGPPRSRGSPAPLHAGRCSRARPLRCSPCGAQASLHETPRPLVPKRPQAPDRLPPPALTERTADWAKLRP